jgi:hypothetical protein
MHNVIVSSRFFLLNFARAELGETATGNSITSDKEEASNRISLPDTSKDDALKPSGSDAIVTMRRRPLPSLVSGEM